jgi:hypothetical protein
METYQSLKERLETDKVISCQDARQLLWDNKPQKNASISREQYTELEGIWNQKQAGKDPKAPLN